MWGANLTLRRSALERDRAASTRRSAAHGDEEDWQRRLRAAGGRIRYVAAAGVDHRRTGADARMRGLVARRLPPRPRRRAATTRCKGVAPPLAAELRTLAGCVWHIVRRRCGNGIVLTALTLGRLREALDPAPVPPAPRDPDYLVGPLGHARRAAALLAGALRDARANVAACARPAARWRAAARARRARRVLVRRRRAAGARRATVARLRRELARSRHDVALRLVAAAPGRRQVGEPQRRARRRTRRAASTGC